MPVLRARLAKYLSVITLTALWPRPANAGEPITLACDDYCPYFCKSAGKKTDDFRGFMVEVVEQTMAGSRYDLDFKVMPWSRALADAESGKISGLLGAGPNRKDVFELSAMPLVLVGTCLYGRADSTYVYKGPLSIAELKMGLIRNYDYNAIKEYVDKYGNDTSKAEWISGEDATMRNLNKMVIGRLDALWDDKFTVNFLAAKHGWKEKIKPLYCPPPTNYGFYMGIGHKNPNLMPFMEAFNKSFAAFRKSDAYQKLEKKYSFSN